MAHSYSFICEVGSSFELVIDEFHQIVSVTSAVKPIHMVTFSYVEFVTPSCVELVTHLNL